MAEDQPGAFALGQLDEALLGLEREPFVPPAGVEAAFELGPARDRVHGEQHGPGAASPTSSDRCPTEWPRVSSSVSPGTISASPSTSL